jgi:O-antigen ligase
MKFFNSYFFLIIVIFSFLKPSGFDIYNMHLINSTINFVRFFFAILIFIKYLGTFHKLSVFLSIQLFFFFLLLISTLINNSKIENFSIFSISVIVFTMLVEIYANTKFRLLIEALFFNYFVILSINLLLMYYIHGFKSEESLIEEKAISFISSDNLTASYLFPALCVSFLYSVLHKNKYNYYSMILYVVVLLTAIKIWSATSLVGIVLILAYIFIFYGTQIEKSVKYSYLIMFAVFLIIGLTFFNIQNYFYFLIVDILEKDITMTGRTNIWQIGINGFNESPIIGMGYGAMIIDNGLIQLLFSGGVLGFCIYIMMFLTGTKKIFSSDSNHNSLNRFFSFVLFTTLIMSISESWFYFFGFFVILNLVNNLDKLSHYLLWLQRRKNEKKIRLY